jgi:hypothetical protein
LSLLHRQLRDGDARCAGDDLGDVLGGDLGRTLPPLAAALELGLASVDLVPAAGTTGSDPALAGESEKKSSKNPRPNGLDLCSSARSTSQVPSGLNRTREATAGRPCR